MSEASVSDTPSGIKGEISFGSEGGTCSEWLGTTPFWDASSKLGPEDSSRELLQDELPTMDVASDALSPLLIEKYTRYFYDAETW